MRVPRAGDELQHVRWYSAAANGSLVGADLLGGETLARRGLATYAPGEARDSSLLLSLAGALTHQSKLVEGRELLLEALDRIPQGSAEWVTGIANLLVTCLPLGDILTPIPWLVRLASLDDALVPSTDLGLGLFMAYSNFTFAGQPALAEAAVAQFDRARRNAAESPGFEGWRRLNRALRAERDPLHISEGYGEACESLRIFESRKQGVDSADDGSAGGALAGFDMARYFVSRLASFFGELELARDQVASAAATPFLQEVLAEPAVRAAIAAGDLAAAEAFAAPALGGSVASTAIYVRTLLAVAYADAGRLAQATETLDGLPSAIEALLGLRSAVHMARSRIALARGDAESALAECDLGDAAAQQWGGVVHTRQLLVLTRAEALMLLGRANDAKRTLASLRAQVDDIASKLDEPARKKYLARGFPAARIVRLAEEWHLAT